MKNIFKKSVKYISLFIAVFCISQAGGWTSVYASILYQQDVSDTFWDMNTHNSGNNLQGFPLGTGLTGSFDGQITIDLYLENQHTNGDVTYYWDLMKCDDSTYSYSSCISIAEFTTYVPTRYTKTLTSSTDNSVSEISFDSSKYYILKKSGNQFSDDRIYGNSIYSIYIKIQGAVPVDTSTRIVSSIPFPQIKVSAYMQSSNTTISVPDTSLFYVGQTVLSIYLPTETYITSIVDGNTLELSNAVNEGTVSGYYDLSAYTTLETHSKSEIQVYVNSSDWVEGMFLKVTFSTVKDTMLGGDVINAVNGYYTKEIEIPSDFAFNQTVTFGGGIIDVLFESHEGINYADFYLGYHNTGFWNSVANFFGFDIDSTYFDQRHFAFVVNAISQFDSWFNNGLSVLANQESVIGSIVENSINTTHSTCNFAGSFDFGDCLAFLFLPTPYDLKLVWEDFSSDVLSVFPLGYVTRMVDIFVNTGAVKPPALIYTFSDTNDSSVSGTGLEGATLSFQIFDHFDVLNSINSDQADNKNIWDIIMPFFNTLVSLAVFLVILGDIMGGGFNTDTSDITDYAKNNVRFSKAELQKLNNSTIAKTEQEYKLYKKL